MRPHLINTDDMSGSEDVMTCSFFASLVNYPL